MSDERYTAWGKSVRRLLEDYERHRMDSDQKGNTVDYLHAALMATSRGATAMGNRWCGRSLSERNCRRGGSLYRSRGAVCSCADARAKRPDADARKPYP